MPIKRLLRNSKDELYDFSFKRAKHTPNSFFAIHYYQNYNNIKIKENKLLSKSPIEVLVILLLLNKLT